MAHRKLKKVDLDRLPSNNRDSPNNPPEVKPVIRSVKKQKKAIIATEVRNITTSLFAEVVLPAIKSAITDFVTNGIEMVIWGQGSNSPSRGGRRRRRNYGGIYGHRDSRDTHSRRPARGRTASMSIDDIYFDTREDAKLTLGRLHERVAEYGWATVGDLYALVGLTSDHTHERYGWDHLGNSRIRHTMDGYIIDLPEPIYN